MLPKRMSFLLFEESIHRNFDQLYIKKIVIFMMHNEYYRWIIKYIFTRNLFGDTDLDIICYKFSQTYKSLT